MANYSRYVRDDDNWMLGPFVLPVGCFAELGPILAPFDVLCRLHISVLGPKTETAPEFLAVLRNAAQALREFHTRYGAIAGATQIEMALPSQPGASMSEARDALGRSAASDILGGTGGRCGTGDCHPDGTSSCDRVGAFWAQASDRRRDRVGVPFVDSDCARPCRGDEVSGADQIHRRFASPNPEVSSQRTDEDAWFPERPWRRGADGRARLERAANRRDAG